MIASIGHRGQFRLLILWRADVSVDVILGDRVDDDLNWPLAVGLIEHDGLVDIDVLLRQVSIIHHQL
jgi:hypothetical protein